MYICIYIYIYRERERYSMGSVGSSSPSGERIWKRVANARRLEYTTYYYTILEYMMTLYCMILYYVRVIL